MSEREWWSGQETVPGAVMPPRPGEPEPDMWIEAPGRVSGWDILGVVIGISIVLFFVLTALEANT